MGAQGQDRTGRGTTDSAESDPGHSHNGMTADASTFCPISGSVTPSVATNLAYCVS